MKIEFSSSYTVTDSLTASEIALIRDSYDRVSVGRRLARNFYARLFEIDPSIRSLFRDDLSVQVMKLTDMLATLVDKLDRPRDLAMLFEELGQRHRTYGVSEHHFAPVGRALFETLASELGPCFDEPTRSAWIALYALAAALMKHRVSSSEDE